MNFTKRQRTEHLLARCIQWFYASENVSPEMIESFIKDISIDEPTPAFVKKVHALYLLLCEENRRAVDRGGHLMTEKMNSPQRSSRGKKTHSE